MSFNGIFDEFEWDFHEFEWFLIVIFVVLNGL